MRPAVIAEQSARRRGVASPVSFLSLTSFGRPAFTPSRTKQFGTAAELNNAISDMQDGDLIQIRPGTGMLDISSSTANAVVIGSKNPATMVVFDFGTKKSLWNPGIESTDYVRFRYTGASNLAGLYLNNSSNLRIYGGEYMSARTGVIMYATHDVLWYDYLIHDTGNSGMTAIPTNGGVNAPDIYNLDFRGEVYNFAMNPANDPHNDKGTGLHGALTFDSGDDGSFYDNRFSIYAHDPLQPGATSYGQIWPEGGGGSGIQIGQTPSGAAIGSGNTVYIKGENLLMIPNATNPGSSGSGQTGGNVVNLWGAVSLDGLHFGWVEGINCTGAVIHGADGTWHNVTNAITVDHGRATNVNQYTGGGNISEPFDSRYGIVYTDCITL